jgi:bifunctional non-homologous end joining protein LigD
MPLDDYRRKRDFRRTPEPAGKAAPGKGGRFVVQRHAARRLHYDFRLELDGVLKSWAVPKGPSLDPAEKRLAVHVEDHPLEYGNFEGTIPAGEYGAGEVVLWDRGRWDPVGDPDEGYRRGKLKFTLHGDKLRGGWTLARMGGRSGEGGKNWLLLKERDVEAREATAGDIVAERPESVAAIARSPLPERVRPQLAVVTDAPPSGDDWLHEIKYDGYRALCRVDGGRARMYVRSGQDWTDRFRPVARACAALPVETAWLDGEVVVLDDEGRSSFEALQQALGGDGREALRYVVFDLLHLDGADLRALALEQRKQRLAALVRRAAGDTLRYGDHVVGRGAAFLRQVCDHGLEGIVSKRRDAPHREGRHADWRKARCAGGGEFVIGGFTDPAGSREGLGALLLGAHEDGGLIYVGRVGTGFSDATLRELRRRLDALEQPASPFAAFPDVPPATHWTRPVLVATVTFTNWTREGRLRHPVFVGLREDKAAAEVERDRPAARDSPGPRRADETTEVEGVRITHPDRVLWPEVEVTKIELARYYVGVAEWMLPQVAGRPLAVVRGPRGHVGTTFFQKHLAPGMPEPVRGVRIRDEEGEQDHLVIDDVAGLVALVQMDVLEIHVWGTLADEVERPDRMVLDLDPDEAIAWSVVVDAARAARLRLEHLGLESFVKTTGGKGLHVVVPLARRHTWSEMKAFARAVSADLARRLPDAFTINPAKAARRDKIYLDYLRNGRGATAIAAYSARARPGAPVSVPLAWEELDASLRPGAFTVRTVLERLAALPTDPWERLATVRQSITAPMRAALGLPRASAPRERRSRS